MELRICCETKIELDDYLKVKEINTNIDDYNFNNGELTGNVIVNGSYFTKNESISTFEKKVPFTLMFKNANYNIETLKVENFKYYDIVNNGIECSFEIYASYEIKISEGSIPNIISEEKEIIEETQPAIALENEEIIDETIKDIDVLDNEPEQIITNIKEKYDELLNNIFLNRDDSVQISEKKDKNFLIKGIKEVKDTIRVYFPKQENEVEKICQSEKVSVSKIYENDLNKDFQNRKRIIIGK